LKQCPNCRAGLADFVPACPYCGVATPVASSGGSPQGPPQTSGKALVSLVSGLLLLFPPAALLAVVFGHLALSDIKKSAGRLTGQGLAVAGLVLGYVGVAAAATFLLAVALVLRGTLRHDVSGNEAAAIETMNTYRMALIKYELKCPYQGFPRSLAYLGPGSGDCLHANLIDGRLSYRTPSRLGYQFFYQPGVHGNDRVTAFALIAKPILPGRTGTRYFYLDEGGVIRQASSYLVGARSEPVDGEASPQGGEDQEDGDSR